ncbi:hypothetical protein, partial [Staphylococcus pseudintermedius]|uniref:hypothetical protein n=1 Tax=Staphylococcus pseudintermedius TaxID=283734 RepID=UPI001C92EFBD
VCSTCVSEWINVVVVSALYYCDNKDSLYVIVFLPAESGIRSCRVSFGFQAEYGIRSYYASRGLGGVYK